MRLQAEGEARSTSVLLLSDKSGNGEAQDCERDVQPAACKMPGVAQQLVLYLASVIAQAGRDTFDLQAKGKASLPARATAHTQPQVLCERGPRLLLLSCDPAALFLDAALCRLQHASSCVLVHQGAYGGVVYRFRTGVGGGLHVQLMLYVEPTGDPEVSELLAHAHALPPSRRVS